MKFIMAAIVAGITLAACTSNPGGGNNNNVLIPDPRPTAGDSCVYVNQTEGVRVEQPGHFEWEMFGTVLNCIPNDTTR